MSLKRRYCSLLFSAVIFVVVIIHGFSLATYPFQRIIRETDDAQRGSPGGAAAHPVDKLIHGAKQKWEQLLSKQVYHLADASREYRRRRGRHPPPGFDQWFFFAQEKEAVIIEDLFDQIYEDLSPYWGMEPKAIRRYAQNSHLRIILRNHTQISVGHTGVNWLETWMDMIGTIAERLPDMDIPLNGMDESRIIVPWEIMAVSRAKDTALQWLLGPPQAVDQYMTLLDQEEVNEYISPTFLGADKPYWEIMRRACPPNSPGRTSNITHLNFTNPPPEFFNYRSFSNTGYIEDLEWSRDPCWRPELQALHGSFIEPVSTSTTHELIPMFGGSKLAVNSDILIPPAVYWDDDPTYSGGKDNHGGPWADKKDIVFWRGIASGGRNRRDTWTGFQRHRFVSMLNGTQVALANGTPFGPNFRLPDYQQHNALSGLDDTLSEFLNNHCDLGFLDLCCFPREKDENNCSYTDAYFSLLKGMSMKEQYAFKYLPDIDGNSFSGRYRAFLLSTSLPIKATLYKEWHDSRLIPWAHFVPVDSLYMDIYGILRYFIGYKGLGGHDRQAERIAMDGKAWAERVLRKEDMQVYVYRLLLEYARLCDDRRDNLAFVGDL